MTMNSLYFGLLLFLLFLLNASLIFASNNSEVKVMEKEKTKEKSNLNWFGNFSAKYLLDKMDKFIGEFEAKTLGIFVTEAKNDAGNGGWPAELVETKFTDEDKKELKKCKNYVKACLESKKGYQINHKNIRIVRNERKLDILKRHAEMLGINAENGVDEEPLKKNQKKSEFKKNFERLFNLRLEIDEFLKQAKLQIDLNYTFKSLGNDLLKLKQNLLNYYQKDFIPALAAKIGHDYKEKSKLQKIGGKLGIVDVVPKTRPLNGIDPDETKFCNKKTGLIEIKLTAEEKKKYNEMRDLFALCNLAIEIYKPLEQIVANPLKVPEKDDDQSFVENIVPANLTKLIYIWNLATDVLFAVWKDLNSKESLMVSEQIHKHKEMPRNWFEEVDKIRHEQKVDNFLIQSSAWIRLGLAEVLLEYEHVDWVYGFSTDFTKWKNLKGLNEQFDAQIKEFRQTKKTQQLLYQNKFPTILCEKIYDYYVEKRAAGGRK